MRSGLKTLNLKFLIDEAQMSKVLTSVVTPSFVTTNKVINKLRDKQIIVYPGKKELTDKIFQVATIGEISQEDVQYFLHSIAEIVKK